MKKTFRMAAAALAIAAVTIGCSAQADQTTDKLKATLQTRLADVTIKSVHEVADCRPVRSEPRHADRL